MCNLVHNMQVGVRFWGSVSETISRSSVMIDVASIQAVSVLIGSRMRAGGIYYDVRVVCTCYLNVLIPIYHDSWPSTALQM